MTETNTTSAVTLTPEQVQNWRRVLSTTIGPYALVMPVVSVQRLRDRFQQMMEKPNGNPQGRAER